MLGGLVWLLFPYNKLRRTSTQTQINLQIFRVGDGLKVQGTQFGIKLSAKDTFNNVAAYTGSATLTSNLTLSSGGGATPY